MRLIQMAGAVLFFAATFQTPALEAERLFYLSGGEVCVGAIYKPKGNGPFRAVVFNQNVAKALPEQGTLDPFPELARFYTSHQYVLFSPGRRKAKDMQEQKGRKAKGEEKSIEQHQAQAETIFSAIETLKAQAFVDPGHIYVTGFGSGASDMLLLAEKEIDVRAFVAFSPAGVDNLLLQNAMNRAVSDTKTPIFLVQSQNDKGLPIFESLVAALKEKGPPNRSKIYPSNKPGNNQIAINGTEIWGNDILKFFKDASK